MEFHTIYWILDGYFHFKKLKFLFLLEICRLFCRIREKFLSSVTMKHFKRSCLNLPKKRIRKDGGMLRDDHLDVFGNYRNENLILLIKLEILDMYQCFLS